ncbi:MAG TPA: thiamine phosphate synthase [Candidatus Acidoferrales bacterium]|nr:thiamine phosphate synthase [Candidatus Acidoferrales bacterium]HEV2422714.1 thiamine phosphate synthase [Candidatus Acidoferrales bacterium]
MFSPLYAVLDEDSLNMPAQKCAQELISAGVELIQYRAKHSSSREYFVMCSNLAETLAARNARLIVNDRPDIAAMVGAGGVHVGQEDLPPDDARRICGSGRWVGISTHSLEQVRAADRTSADYIAIGPIFSTSTKEKPDAVVGTSFIREARKLTQKPIVAIGGITRERAAEVYGAGADSIAVIRELLETRDPAERAKEFLAIAKRSREMQRSSRTEVS